MNIQLPSVFPVTCHTKHVGPGSTFVAIKGYSQDGADYISQALQQGATTIVIADSVTLDQAILDEIYRVGARLVKVPDARLALAQLSAQAHGYPAKKLKIIGITGTKGKTTTTFLLEHVLRSAGIATALVSTVKNSIKDVSFPMQLTTPQPDYLHAFFSVCVEQGVEYVVMEVAAQALTLHRVAGIEFDVVLFTNFSKEHAEFYHTMDDYFAAKCLIFNHLKKSAFVAVNADDEHGKIIIQRHPEYISWSLSRPDSPVYAEVIGDVRDGITMRVHSNGIVNTFACPALIGLFNVYNAVGVITIAQRLELSAAAIQQGLESFEKVPGRLEQHRLDNGARCFIDYAHNPSSYEAVLSTLRSLTDHLLVVFGCGGNRDQGKRPLMGEIASRIADVVIVTSDNPRKEDPLVIVADIKRGIAPDNHHKIIEELDREKAIEIACRLSKPGTIIALLGKGPDEYQIIGDIKFSFSEAEIVRRFQKEL